MEARGDEFAQNVEVEFNEDNINKCRCMQCPVQGTSQCADDKMRAMSGMMQEMQMMEDPPAPEDVPGVYCGTGTASCSDLDFTQTCICSSCAVWQESGLGSWKYCKSGPASEIG